MKDAEDKRLTQRDEQMIRAQKFREFETHYQQKLNLARAREEDTDNFANIDEQQASVYTARVHASLAYRNMLDYEKAFHVTRSSMNTPMVGQVMTLVERRADGEEIPIHDFSLVVVNSGVSRITPWGEDILIDPEYALHAPKPDQDELSEGLLAYACPPMPQATPESIGVEAYRKAAEAEEREDAGVAFRPGFRVVGSSDVIRDDAHDYFMYEKSYLGTLERMAKNQNELIEAGLPVDRDRYYDLIAVMFMSGQQSEMAKLKKKHGFVTGGPTGTRVPGATDIFSSGEHYPYYNFNTLKTGDVVTVRTSEIGQMQRDGSVRQVFPALVQPVALDISRGDGEAILKPSTPKKRRLATKS